MKVRWQILLATAALVFWLFAAATVVRAQECPVNGWLLAAGPTVSNVIPLADGPLPAWANSGWRFEDNGVQVKAIVSVTPQGVVLRSYVLSETGAWIEREVFAMEPHQLVPCLLKTVEPVMTDAEGQPVYLFLGHAPALVNHDHADVQSIDVGAPSIPELRKS